MRLYPLGLGTWEHDMFEDPRAPTPDIAGYRGHITCNRTDNYLTFHLPGPHLLVGGAKFALQVVGVDTEGYRTQETIYFETENPGLEVRLRQLRHEFSGTCDHHAIDRRKRCDTYVAIGSYNTNWPRAEQAPGVRQPLTGDWEDWNTSEVKTMDEVLFSTEQAVPFEIGITFVFMDHDAGNRAKNAMKVLGAVIEAIGKIVEVAGQPVVGKIVAAVGKVVTAVSSVIKEDKDDLIGAHTIVLQQVKQLETYEPGEIRQYWLDRWVTRFPTGTGDRSRGWEFAMPLSKGTAYARLLVVEKPMSWTGRPY
jgi:hypothetical protein